MTTLKYWFGLILFLFIMTALFPFVGIYRLFAGRWPSWYGIQL